MARLVQLSEAGSLALHSMILLAQSKEGFLKVDTIAQITDSSRNHLAKVMQVLSRHNFVSAERGPNGGYVLARPASDITLLNVLEAIEGPIDTSGCQSHKQVCPFGKCLMSGIVHQASELVKNYLQSQTLELFVSDPNKLGEIIN